MEEENLFDDIGGDSTIDDFEDRRYECFGLRLENEEVVFTLNNKIVLTISKDDFPIEIDLNSVEDIANLVSLVRTEGLAHVVDKYNLPAEQR